LSPRLRQSPPGGKTQLQREDKKKTSDGNQEKVTRKGEGKKEKGGKKNALLRAAGALKIKETSRARPQF